VHYRSRGQGAQNTYQTILNEHGQAHLLHADLRSEQAIKKLISKTVDLLGGLEILVNNAGIILKASIGDTTADHWDDTLNTNLRAPYLLSRLVAKHMIHTKSPGVILHNTSIHANLSCPSFSAYAASKAGLEALAKVQAMEWAEHQIRVNCFAPGVIPVERTAKQLQASKHNWLPHIPLNRFGHVDDIANLCLFLASEQANWITGQSFVADGGTSARIDLPRRKLPEPPAAPTPIESD